ncbi:MAG: putative nucleotidyltransferase substrate binding domain-containing protein, partial [Pseudomonadota bacterium]
SAREMVPAVAKIPELLASLIGAGTRHQIATRLITDVADAATRRLLALAEETLGLPPCPYLWLACGSQGRQEQTGVSDQDNCLILSNEVRPRDRAYFVALARFVCDGLNTVGYVYCPGDMMATAERWCQPRSIWQGYFAKWIAEPGPEAQMLASVMFDLRPIGGDATLWEGLHAETLEAARGNSIFVSHMVSNALKHTPPLGLFRGFALEKKGAHRNTVDLKHAGVVPVTDLARIYALQGADPSVNTRARLAAAMDAGTLSASGGQDLLDAYDLIAETRLTHQTRQIRVGERPDNHMAPASLSELERSHLRDAFVVVKTMQSALGQGRGHLG